MLRRRKPFVPQMEAVECGAACLTMALHHFGHHAELSEVRDKTGVSRDGVSAAAIARVAREYGLEVKARRLEPHDLSGVRGVAVLHWEMNHFVLLDRWTPDAVLINDPGVGPRRVSPEDFDRSFTGICLELSPGEGFRKRPRRRATVRRYLALLREARGPLAILFGASVMLNLLGLTLPVSMQVIVDQVINRGQVTWLDAVGAGVVALVAMLFLTSMVRVGVLSALRHHLDASIGLDLVRHLLTLPVRFFAQRQTADLVGRVEGVRQLRELLAGQAVALLVDAVLLVGYLALMTAYEWRIGLLVAGGCVLYVVVFAALRPRLSAVMREHVVRDVKHGQQLLQTVRGIQTVKSTGREHLSFNSWLRLFVNALNLGTEQSRLQALAGAVLLGLQLAVASAVLAWGARLVIDSELTLGTLLGIQLLLAAVLGPLDRVIKTLLLLEHVPIQLGRMDDVLLTPSEPTGERPCHRLQGEVVFESISFRYGPTAPLVLDGVSLTVGRGQKVALVGASGCGKSTLARLLVGLHRPTGGRILIDGHDLEGIELASMRRQVGVVMQETTLLEGSVRENISLYHRRASLDDVISAARVAQIHDDIQALPQGYDTPLSASGSPLSGGQRQRLALARAILHHPPLMILDEATSALDPVTEAAVERYLSSRLCTRIVIAHRLSTVRDADLIAVFSQGRIVERGRHDELLALGGHYARLVAGGEASGRSREDALPAPADGVRPEDLRTFQPLAGLSDDEGHALAARLERNDVAAGATLVHQGERGAGLFLVESGALDVVIQEPGLPPFRVGVLGPGALLGEVSMLDGSPASATVTATEPARVLHLRLADFEELRSEQDRLAERLISGLGALVAERLRAATDRLLAAREETEVAASSPAGGRPSGEAAAAARGATRPMRVGETSLGAALTDEEVVEVEELGTTQTLGAGDALFVEGDPSESSFLVLRGRLAFYRTGAGAPVRIVRAGELCAEEGLFHPHPRTESCRALEPATVFTLRHAELRRRVADGDPAAWKVLRHAAHALVRTFRVANLRLREATALQNDEIDQAFRAREEALRLERSDDAGLGALAIGAGDHGVPLVRCDDGVGPEVACVTAVLRFHGRAVPVITVAEACTEGGAVTDRSLAQGVRSFGLLLRSLTLTADDLRFLERPLVARWKEAGYVVVERARAGGFDVMDPTEGKRWLTFEELRRSFEGSCLEIRPDEAARRLMTLQERVISIVQRWRAAVVPLIVTTVMLQLCALALPVASGIIVEQVVLAGDGTLLGLVAVALLAVLTLQALVAYERLQTANHLRTHLEADLLDGLLRHALRLPIAFFERHPPGALLERFDAFRRLRAIIGNDALLAVVDLPVLVISLAYMTWLDARLALVVAGVASVAGALVLLALRRLRSLALEERSAASDQRERLIEIIQGIVTLRMSGDASAGLRHWLPAFGRELRAATQQDLLASTVLTGTQMLRYATLAFATWWGGAQVLSGRMELGALVAFTALAALFLAGWEGAIAHLAGFARAADAVQVVGSLFTERPEVLGEGGGRPGKLRGRIQLDSVTFHYDRDGPAILRDVSLEIEPGSKVALVGASGCGKSTLGKLLLGFYVPTSGRVLFDGKDLRSLDLSAVRGQLGVVLQDTFLFTGSIRDNLTLCAPHAPLSAVVDAAKGAAIHDTIDRMAMKYETVVAEGGSAFSGGERQRIALARAILPQPSILLLDEATSALDNASQAAVESNLARMACTRVVIAHRLSTVRDADLIVVLDRGRIVESGSHEELLERGGRYHQLVQAQIA